MQLETDYLVIGAGAAAMAFVDALVTDSKADILVVDRRHAPGGHWHDAYGFVHLHQPSTYYGVNSLPLGRETIDTTGPNAGYYEQASAPEICAYYDRVMQSLLASGRVRYFPMSEHTGGTSFTQLLTGETHTVTVRKRVVDARYLEPLIPKTTPPPFAVGDGVRCIPVGELAQRTQSEESFVVIGSGKTASDACVWLLRQGVAPARIKWVRPRDAWFVNRAYSQGGELVGAMFEGFTRQVEAAAAATSIADLFARLEATEQLLRVDPNVPPTMFRGATMSTLEIAELRRIEDVVRLGHVKRIERDRIVLTGGEVPTSPRALHVHCAAPGLNPAAAIPIFADDRITPQPVRIGLVPFNAALVGYIEATRADTSEKNRLCPPNRMPVDSLDWLRGTLIQMTADYGWSKEPDIVEWLERSRLNPTRGLRARGKDPAIQATMGRFGKAAGAAMKNLSKLLAGS